MQVRIMHDKEQLSLQLLLKFLMETMVDKAVVEPSDSL